MAAIASDEVKVYLLFFPVVFFMEGQCFNIRGDVLFVQEINEKVKELIDSLTANLSQNLHLVERDSPKSGKQGIAYESLLQRKKRKHPYTSRVGCHAEMMRQY